ncbi:MAG: hypothetical protein JJU06_11590 [Ectothiorhodospiraceae bacterium]|nr:hypothetical protein [Ectothiorhodospiraceae bacterium]
MRLFKPAPAALILSFALTATAFGQTGEDLAHRDDFTMNAISGGDFRGYVSDAVVEDDIWGHSMRTLGVFHNHMHELMSEYARHAAEEMGSEHVPEFENRISGGEWTDYRRNLEDAGDTSAWADFVQVTEIMHDRVHHAMYTSALYDMKTRDRDVDLADYVGDRAPHDQADTIPERSDLAMDYASSDAFRLLVWDYDFEGERLHAAMQKMTVFDNMLSDLMTQWAFHGASKDDEACRPPEFDSRISGEQWSAYAERVADCDDETWRDLVRITELMHDRIHHMMHAVMIHDGGAHGRENEVKELLE